MPQISPTFAYVAEGKLYLKHPDQPARLIESTFAQELLDRAERQRERGDWKNSGMSWNLTRAAVPMLAAGAMPAEVRRIRFSGVTRGGHGKELYYALDTDHVGALLQFDLVDGYERRLYHRNQFQVTDLARHPALGLLAMSVQAGDGTAYIAIAEPDGRRMKQITEGDSVDESPAWRGEGRTILYQSAGVGRDQHGLRVGLGPYTIQQIDLESGEMKTLVEHEQHDCLLPRAAADGSLLYIRRPYEPLPRVSPWKIAQDIVLFPFRLVRAIVHFLDYFSLMFSRKPLITSGGPPRQGPDARFMMLWGKMIDAEKILRRRRAGGSAALVPKDWQLVRHASDGAEEVLARAVISYDLCDDGSILYTNGTSIFHRSAGGEEDALCDGHLIERVTALQTP